MNKIISAVICAFLLCFALAAVHELGCPSPEEARLIFSSPEPPQETEEPPALTLPPVDEAAEGPAAGADILVPGGNPQNSGSRFPFESQNGTFPADIHSDPNLIRSILQPYGTLERFNNELQIYIKDHSQVHGRHLYMTAEPSEDGYTSGMIRSSISFQYCDLTLRVHTINQPGLLPAIWMLPDSGSKRPEIDIYEGPGFGLNRLYGVIHYSLESNRDRDYFYMQQKQSHEIRLLWTEDEVSWYVDGVLQMTATEHIPHEQMFLIFNLAVGGDWPGLPTEETVFPAVFHVEILNFQPQNVRLR